jgi:transaldolase
MANTKRLHSRNLKNLIDTWHISGVTTNPPIFQAALKDGASQMKQFDELAARGATVDDTVREVTNDDVRDACDLFTGIFQATGYIDGRVSIEVDPRPARQTQATIDQAGELHEIVDPPNVLIKIPSGHDRERAIRALDDLGRQVTRGVKHVGTTLVGIHTAYMPADLRKQLPRLDSNQKPSDKL